MADTLLEFEQSIYSGSTVYAVMRNSIAYWMNGTTGESYNVSHWGNYAVALTEVSGTGYFTGPTPAVTADWYDVGIRIQTGGSPAHTDVSVGGFSAYWDGSAWHVDDPVVLAANGLDNIVVETGVNARQALSPILAAAAGVLSGAGSGTILVQAGANAGTNRITATTDSEGNRSAVALNLPM